MNYGEAASIFRELQRVDEVPEVPQAPLVPGFLIERLLGEGGSGEVFEAVSTKTGRRVALKIMRHPIGDRDTAQRAWREFDALDRVRTPCVPRLDGYGEVDGRFYIATEFIDGHPITTYAHRARLGQRQALELVANVCEAVQDLHEHGVLHRDLKPGNILIDNKGRPVIIDLGLASIATGSGGTLGAEGMPVGTPAYMSPEQARGEHPGVSTRSDVYALGAIARLLVTGTTPHDTGGPLMGVISRIASTPARRPREQDPSVPPSLDAVLAKATAFEPEERYASAAGFAADLRRYLRGEPVEARPPGAWVRGVRWVMRHPVLTTGIGCTGLLIFTVVVMDVAVRYSLAQPFGAELGPSARRVYVVSRAGGRLGPPLVTFAEDSAGNLPEPRILERPRSMGGGAFVLSADHAPGGTGTTLSAFDLSTRERVWSAPVPAGFPALREPSYRDASARRQHSYALSRFILADVFPELPGEEIIAQFLGTPDFPSFVSVYRASGACTLEEVFRVWVPGHERVIWLPRDRCMVLAGAHNRMPTPYRLARSELDPQHNAQVVMFIRPELGRLDDRWLTNKIEETTSNTDACWVLEQPWTHVPDPSTEDSFTLSVERTMREGPGEFRVLLGANHAGVKIDGEPQAFWTTNRKGEPVTSVVFTNNMPARFRELAEQVRFVEAPACDPNPPD